MIDFKTDSVPDEQTLHNKVVFYKPQIDACRQAVATLTGLSPERITARLLFVSPGIVYEYK